MRTLPGARSGFWSDAAASQFIPARSPAASPGARGSTPSPGAATRGPVRCAATATPPKDAAAGSRRTLPPRRLARNCWPMSAVKGAGGRNCVIASRPTGMTSAGLSNWNSAPQPAAARADFRPIGTRSPPAGSGPGKQRQTAVMYTSRRKRSSGMPQPCKNHENSVLPPSTQTAGPRPAHGVRAPGRRA